jgi:glyoxylase-like metal-dependent hydrolase (beta-lactamase superfamily II)
MGRVACVLAAVLALGAGSASAQTPAADPVVQVVGLKPLSLRVQVIPDNSVGLVPNVGFVVGRTGVLVVDTGLGPANGAAVAAVAQKIAPGRKIYLVATHAHPEHDLGAQAFPAGTVMIRSRDQAGEKAADLRLAGVFSTRSPAIAERLKGAEFRPADQTFDKEQVLDLGGVSVTLLAMGPAHTAGDIAIWMPTDRVLFSGDLAMKAQPSILAEKATIATWTSALDRLETLKPSVVVPSHGPIGDAAYIRGYRAYLDEVAQKTAEAKAKGQTLDAATAAIAEAMADRYPDRARLAGAVKMAWGS